MKPYYDQIECEVGVCGNYDHLEDLARRHLPPARAHEVHRQADSGRRGEARRASDSCSQSDAEPAREGPVRRATSAETAWRVAMWWRSTTPPTCICFRRIKSGKPLTIRPNSIVYELAVAADSPRVKRSALFRSGNSREGSRKAVWWWWPALARRASALLLMSKSSRFPTGLANSSGELGTNFIPHINVGIEAFLEDRIGIPTDDDEGFLDHAYIPSFMHAKKRDYPRSFGFQFNYQNQRSVGWARRIKGMGKVIQGDVKVALSGVHYLHRLPGNGPERRLTTSISMTIARCLRTTASPPLGSSPSHDWKASQPCAIGALTFSKPVKRPDPFRQRRCPPRITRSAAAGWAMIPNARS